MPATSSPLSGRAQRVLGALDLLVGLWLCTRGIAVWHAALPGLTTADRAFYYVVPLAFLLLGLWCVLVGLRTIRSYPAPPVRGTSIAFALGVMLIAGRIVAPFMPKQPDAPAVGLGTNAPLTPTELTSFWLNLLTTVIAILAGLLLHRYLRRPVAAPASRDTHSTA
jgi:hypothetical protein